VEGDVLVAVQQVADGKGHFRGRQLGRRHLVEQRLEGLVVVVAEERDADVRVAQLFERADAAETGAEDDDVWPTRHGPHLWFAGADYRPGLLCIMPPSAKTVVAVM